MPDIVAPTARTNSTTYLGTNMVRPTWLPERSGTDDPEDPYLLHYRRGTWMVITDQPTLVSPLYTYRKARALCTDGKARMFTLRRNDEHRIQAYARIDGRTVNGWVSIGQGNVLTFDATEEGKNADALQKGNA